MELEVLEVKIDGITKLINEKFDRNKEEHKKIVEQTTRTNGRVRSLEKWRYAIGGSIAVIVFVLGLIGRDILLSYIK